MNEKQRVLCATLATMSSEQAADWLMKNYPIDSIDYGEALILMPHRSWKRSDQKRLAQYYFRRLPYSSSRGYEAFASFMSTGLLLECVKERFPMSTSEVELLLYYLVPSLRKNAKNESDRQEIIDFINSI